MAVRVRDLMLLGSTGEWYGNDENITLDLDWLLDHTVESDWDPPTADRAAWDVNQPTGNYLKQEKAQELADELNGV